MDKIFYMWDDLSVSCGERTSQAQVLTQLIEIVAFSSKPCPLDLGSSASADLIVNLLT